MWQTFRYPYRRQIHGAMMMAPGEPFAINEQINVDEVRLEYQAGQPEVNSIIHYYDQMNQSFLIRISHIIVRIFYGAMEEHPMSEILHALQALANQAGLHPAQQQELQNAYIERQQRGMQAQANATGPDFGQMLRQQQAHVREQFQITIGGGGSGQAGFPSFVLHQSTEQRETKDEHAPSENFDEMGARPVVKEILKGVSQITKDQAKARIAKHLAAV